MDSLVAFQIRNLREHPRLAVNWKNLDYLSEVLVTHAAFVRLVSGMGSLMFLHRRILSEAFFAAGKVTMVGLE